jgi:hypothetical protein
MAALQDSHFIVLIFKFLNVLYKLVIVHAIFT